MRSKCLQELNELKKQLSSEVELSEKWNKRLGGNEKPLDNLQD